MFVCCGNFRKFQSGLPQAVGLLKSVDVRSRDSALLPKNAEETPGTSKAAKRTNAPFQDRDLDPPLELYCW